MKLCKDCKHFSTSNPADAKWFATCDKEWTSPVDGRIYDKHDHACCSALRSQEFHCGAEAKGFEAKENPPKPFPLLTLGDVYVEPDGGKWVLVNWSDSIQVGEKTPGTLTYTFRRVYE